MNHTFIHNQTAGVSVQTALVLSIIFLSIGCMMFFQSDALYGGFDKMQVELQRIIKL